MIILIFDNFKILLLMLINIMTTSISKYLYLSLSIYIFLLWQIMWWWLLLLVLLLTYMIILFLKHFFLSSRFVSCLSKTTLDSLAPSSFWVTWAWPSWWWVLLSRFTQPGRRQTGTQTELRTSAEACTYLCSLEGSFCFCCCFHHLAVHFPHTACGSKRHSASWLPGVWYMV